MTVSELRLGPHGHDSSSSARGAVVGVGDGRHTLMIDPSNLAWK